MTVPAAPEAAANELELRDLVAQLVARKWLLIGAGAIVLGAVAAYTFLATPRYASEAVLRIEAKKDAKGMSDALADIPGAGLLGMGKDELETEVGVLRSRLITDAAIDSLGLVVRMTEPPGNRSAVFASVRVTDSSDARGTVRLTRGEGGRYRVAAEGFVDGGAPTATAAVPGDTLRVGPVRLTLAPALASGGPATVEFDLLPRYRVREWFDRRLSIKRQEGGSRLVEVTYEDPDRHLAQQVVSRLVDEFIVYTRRTDAREDGMTVEELRDEVDRSTRRLADADAALTAFQQRSGLVAPQEQATAQVKRITALDTQMDQLGVERAALEKVIALVGQRAASGSDPRAYRQLATFPSLISNRAIQDLLQTLVELGNQRSQLAVRRTSDNEDYRQVVGRIAELEQQLYRLAGQYLESLDQQLETTSHQVTVLTDTLTAMPATEVQFVKLARARGIASEEYVALRKQLKLAEVTDLLRKERVRVIDPPRVANAADRAFPKKAVFLALGAVLAALAALVVGLGAVLLARRA